MKNKTTMLKELVNEAVEIVEYREKHRGNLRLWYWDGKKKSKARFKRLRLMIEETLRSIENER